MNTNNQSIRFLRPYMIEDFSYLSKILKQIFYPYLVALILASFAFKLAGYESFAETYGHL